MLYVGQKMIRYLYGWNKNGKDFKVNVEDKIIIKEKDKTPITGEVCSIGTKYLDLQVEPILMYRPRMDGRCSSTRIIRILIDNIERVAIYPEGSQKYGQIYLR